MPFTEHVLVTGMGAVALYVTLPARWLQLALQCCCSCSYNTEKFIGLHGAVQLQDAICKNAEK